MCSKTNHATGFSQWLMTNLVASPFMGDGRLVIGDKFCNATFAISFPS
ncbi:hypothetical protein Q2T83_11230 [Fervidibacter sacchari]|uniref:Uncharacterized protein n=1 Tax=Candidatus Fervidibacter sacchari TaxID=1448929 RepID=A0ABT2ESL6_9BACT|nr:hypothetical protein [Candidatus Fervidibacter sacchari]MCS3920963.1 hypothetical protein [Candidatus Fervidibacter sacchari]WKU14908.1 hypothetical protein Q2T83_11230 [Candidatus Fervidibacter sacchari]